MTDHPTRNLNQPGPEPEREHPTQRLGELRPCLRCGQGMFLAEAGIAQNGSGVPAFRVCTRVQTAPGIFAPHYAWSSCYVLICPDCGYTEFYTAYPRTLLEAEP